MTSTVNLHKTTFADN